MRKLTDAVLALKVEGTLNKQQILADYLSTIPTGPGLYGVDSAACAYFSQPLERLSLGQLALLAGLTQAPSAYDPLLHADAAARRRHEVLQSMLDGGYITPEKLAAADAEPLLPSAVGTCRA